MPVTTPELLREGILSDYRGVYADTRKAMDPRVGLVVDLGAQTNGRTNTRGYIEAPPHPRYQAQGEPIHTEGMGAKSFTIANFPYSLRIEWHKDDREDDRTGSLREMAQSGAKNHALLPERFLFDYINDSATTLPAVGNAADGTALWSTSTRFEVSTGNDLTVSSWSASGPAARGALFTALEQFYLYKDGKGQPLFTDATLGGPLLVMHAAADMDVMAEAFHQGTVAYAASTSNAGVDNVLTASNGVYSRNFIPWPTQRLATGKMVVALTSAPVRPFLLQTRTPIVESYADETNDPESRNTGIEYVQWRQRLGFGAGAVYSILRVNA